MTDDNYSSSLLIMTWSIHLYMTENKLWESPFLNISNVFFLKVRREGTWGKRRQLPSTSGSESQRELDYKRLISAAARSGKSAKPLDFLQFSLTVCFLDCTSSCGSFRRVHVSTAPARFTRGASEKVGARHTAGWEHRPVSTLIDIRSYVWSRQFFKHWRMY